MCNVTAHVIRLTNAHGGRYYAAYTPRAGWRAVAAPERAYRFPVWGSFNNRQGAIALFQRYGFTCKQIARVAGKGVADAS